MTAAARGGGVGGLLPRGPVQLLQLEGDGMPRPERTFLK